MVTHYFIIYRRPRLEVQDNGGVCSWSAREQTGQRIPALPQLQVLGLEFRLLREPVQPEQCVQVQQFDPEDRR